MQSCYEKPFPKWGKKIFKICSFITEAEKFISEHRCFIIKSYLFFIKSYLLP